LAAGLKDPDPTVRQAAATGLTTVLDQLFPKNSTFSTGNKVDVQQWVLDFIAGTQRPAWMATLKPDLEKMIVSPDEQTRVAAAVSLCALAGEAEAWPVLQKAADSELARGTEAAALPWLKWDRRKALWDHLVAITPDGQMPMLIEHFAAVPDPRAATPLWNILRDPPRDALLSSVHEALETVYELSDSRMRSMDRGQPQPPTAQLDKCLADANAMLQSGGELQKVEALCLLFTVSPEKAAPAARKIFDDKINSPPSLRADALQIILISQANQQSAEPIAAQAISDPAVRKIAVSYLALGSETISTIRDSVYLNSSIVFNADVSGSGEQLSPIIPVHVPAVMDVAALAQLLTDGDQDIAGYAGYLLAIQGDHRGLPPLMRAMEAHGLQDGEWATLVYRAITKLDDDSQTPTLQRIYESFNKQVWEVHQFYWTIRAMHGPNVLKLRKRIRDEIGMEQLQ
jgi:HEAT repeat protein